VGGKVDLPYSHVVNYCKILDLTSVPGIVQHSWAILNDAYVHTASISPYLTYLPLAFSFAPYERQTNHKRTHSLQTPIYTHHQPQTLACFAIHLSTRLHGIPLPDKWWILFDADEADMEACCGWVLRLWDRWGGASQGSSGIGKVENEDAAQQKEEEEAQCARWMRTWKMATSRHYVKGFVDKGSLEGEYGWVDV
jgi:hypothetical protein